MIARFALGANTRPETVYPLGRHRQRAGAPLSGRHRYRIRFARGKLPPADAFWSLTMYENDGYLHPNASRRYAIGDRTPGLRRGARRLAHASPSSTRAPRGAARRELAARAARAASA